MARGTDLTELFDAILDHVPPPKVDVGAPLRALVCNLDASPYVGRLALVRIVSGTLERGQPVAWCRLDGTIEEVRITELYRSEGLDGCPPRTPDPVTSWRSRGSRRSPSARPSQT